MTTKDIKSDLKTLNNKIMPIALDYINIEEEYPLLTNTIKSDNVETKNIHLEFEKLNKQLNPLIYYYKNLQKVYLMAVNKGGCFITIDGNCNGDPSKSRHPYFYDLLQQDSLEACRQSRDNWSETCQNNSIDFIYTNSKTNNIYNKTEGIRLQLDKINNKIITILEKMKKVVKHMETFEDESLYENTKKTLLSDIDKMMTLRKKLSSNSNNSNKSLYKEVYSNYSKYIYSLCLVIFLIGLLIYSIRTQNTMLSELVIVLLIILMIWHKIKYYIYKFFKVKLF